MRTSLILLCFAAVACADKLGYNYQPVPRSDEGLSFSPGGSGVAAATFDAPAVIEHGEAVLSPSIDAPVQQAPESISAPAPVAAASAPIQSAPLPAEYQKEFYSYSAPESEFNDDDAAGKINSAIKKSLRVVFIKAPENQGLENAALALAKQASDDKTAIYVLSKQSDIGDLANKLNAARNNNNNKPEVHFVKYRTPEDAANAQHAIQSQYDSLGGSSQSHNGGVAPVLNFASQAPAPSPSVAASVAAPVAAQAGPGSQYLPSNPVPSQDYLPPSLRRFRL